VAALIKLQQDHALLWRHPRAAVELRKETKGHCEIFMISSRRRIFLQSLITIISFAIFAEKSSS
jgi:hypothetical protein